MKDLASPFSPEPASSVKMFFSENDLDKPQDTGFKKKILNSIKGFKELKEDRKKKLNEIKRKRLQKNKCLSDTQGNTDVRLME